MMHKQGRQAKHLNETGSAKGDWYINRLDFFEFHRYPEYTKHKVLSVLVMAISFYFFLH